MSKNPDPDGCPDTVIGECEAICARCQRDMHPELLELREVKATVSRLLAECDRISQHIREHVPHLPPDAGHLTVHVIRKYFEKLFPEATYGPPCPTCGLPAVALANQPFCSQLCARA